MKRKAIAVLVGLGAMLAVSACSSTSSTIQHNNGTINGDLQRLQAAEPLPKLLDSADLRDQNYLYTAESDPNKLWYLETLSWTGSVEGSYTIRGPVVAASDQVTSPTQLYCQVSSGEAPNGCGVVGLAEPNGVYTGNTNDHIAVLTTGAILRWEGPYQVSDQPFTVRTPAVLNVNESAPISHTDLSKSEGGKVPPKG